ncbi:hypothetical protein ACPA54_03000 [Uniformispora flossi]|uniref:hypothetical protein n=1 Tax=Uniformispora flossi TaxID=3390723 RepID=UPI003C308500
MHRRLLGRRPRRCDSRDLADAHAELRAAHGRLDNLRGAPALYTQALEHHHRQITAGHAAAATTAERRRISVLPADTGGFVGFLTYDLGSTHDAAALQVQRRASICSPSSPMTGELSCGWVVP